MVASTDGAHNMKALSFLFCAVCAVLLVGGLYMLMYAAVFKITPLIGGGMLFGSVVSFFIGLHFDFKAEGLEWRSC
jgi:hypothetical protein